MTRMVRHRRSMRAFYRPTAAGVPARWWAPRYRESALRPMPARTRWLIATAQARPQWLPRARAPGQSVPGVPAAVTITTPTSPTTTVTNFSASGTYNMVWTTTNGCTDIAVITANNNCACPITGNTITQPSPASSCTPYAGTTIMGSVPSPGESVYLWEVRSGEWLRCSAGDEQHAELHDRHTECRDLYIPPTIHHHQRGDLQHDQQTV